MERPRAKKKVESVGAEEHKVAGRKEPRVVPNEGLPKSNEHSILELSGPGAASGPDNFTPTGDTSKTFSGGAFVYGNYESKGCSSRFTSMARL